MEDQIISFQTAKFAKSKSFECSPPCQCYNVNGKMTSGFDVYCLAPTQSRVQRWLREKHNVFIIIGVDQNNGNAIFNYCIFQPYKKYTPNVNGCGYDFKTYEECLENAIFESFKLI